jgi:PPOX class probable F420-dependent enzyme
MTPELERGLKRYQQWFGSYKKSGELKKIHIWLTVSDGRIEFLTAADSFKAKRVQRNPGVICFVGSENGPSIPGTAKIVSDEAVMQRVYRAYRKSHPIAMLWLGVVLKKRMEHGKQVAICVQPDEPNPLAGVTDPVP